MTPAETPAQAPSSPVAPSAAPAAAAPAAAAPAAGVTSASPAAEERHVKSAPPKKRRHHGTLYRWVAAYLPLVAILFALLGVVWVWTYVNPPPPTPAQRWDQIEAKWTPAREKARADLIEQGTDFGAQLVDYKAFYDATQGWLDDVRSFDWTKADTQTESVSNYVQTFLSDGDNYLALLKAAYQAKTADDILVMQDTLPAADQTWETDRALVRVSLGLKAVPEASELPVPSPQCIPLTSGSPGESASPSAATSPLESGSPGASVSPEVTLPPCPAPTPTASAEVSASPAPSPSPSPS